MPDQPEVSRVVTAVFRAWREADIAFLVLRNYERLPDFTTNDIDVLVAPGQRAAAERTLLAAASQAGFRLHNRAEFATLALYLSNGVSTTQVHFDLFTALKWRAFDFLDCEGYLARRLDRGLFSIPHPGHEAATNLLAVMIYSGKVKDKYKASIAAGFRAEPGVAEELLARSYGAQLARAIVAAGSAERWTDLERLTGSVRRALIFRHITRRPLTLLLSLGSEAARLIRRLLQPPGLFVVLCGADGSGKSTAAAAIREGLSSTFSPLKSRYFHWKPCEAASRRNQSSGPATDPHARPPRNAVLSLAYFAFHWLEFFLGSRFRLRPILFRGGLVLIDRYYYDFFVDQRRYRLRVPRALVSLGYQLIKKPDVVLLLDAPATVLQARKQEVPPAETERQCAAYRELVRNLPNGIVIDATRSAAEVGAEIQRRVLDFLAQRAESRGNGK
jgi:thymidylate kinase